MNNQSIARQVGSEIGETIKQEAVTTAKEFIETGQEAFLVCITLGLLGISHEKPPEEAIKQTPEKSSTFFTTTKQPELNSEQKEEQDKQKQIKAIRTMIAQEQEAHYNREKELEAWRKQSDEDMAEPEKEEQPGMNLDDLGSAVRPGAGLFNRKAEYSKKQGM